MGNGSSGRANMHDVARVAGVSATTVSHVLNGTRFVREETEERVQRAIEQLSYRPNLIARGLKMRQTHTIGVVIVHIGEPFYTQLTYHIDRYAEKNGYNIFLCDSNGDVDREKKYIEMLISKGVDGIVLSSIATTAADYRGFDWHGVPVVQADIRVPGLDRDYVGIDNVEAAELATRHLIESGSSNPVVLISGGSSTMLERREGFMNVVSTMPDTVNATVIDAEEHLAAEAVRNALMGNPEIDGILVGNDNLCAEVHFALQELGYSDPERMHVATFDEARWMRMVPYPLTVIRQPIKLIAEKTFDILMRRIAARETEVPSDGHHDIRLRAQIVHLGVESDSSRGTRAQ
jgi:DNA-binding LacI/PurR family transcriptional regulator